VWTIGYGHTGGVVQGDEITEVEASDILLEDLAEAESHVARLGCPLSQLQFDALVSLVYNVGPVPSSPSARSALPSAGSITRRPRTGSSCHHPRWEIRLRGKYRP
jgi:lysozyme